MVYASVLVCIPPLVIRSGKMLLDFLRHGSFSFVWCVDEGEFDPFSHGVRPSGHSELRFEDLPARAERMEAKEPQLLPVRARLCSHVRLHPCHRHLTVVRFQVDPSPSSVQTRSLKGIETGQALSTTRSKPDLVSSEPPNPRPKDEKKLTQIKRRVNRRGGGHGERHFDGRRRILEPPWHRTARGRSQGRGRIRPCQKWRKTTW